MASLRLLSCLIVKREYHCLSIKCLLTIFLPNSYNFDRRVQCILPLDMLFLHITLLQCVYLQTASRNKLFVCPSMTVIKYFHFLISFLLSHKNVTFYSLYSFYKFNYLNHPEYFKNHEENHFLFTRIK